MGALPRKRNGQVPSLEAFAQLCKFALFLDLDTKLIDALFFACLTNPLSPPRCNEEQGTITSI